MTGVRRSEYAAGFVAGLVFLLPLLRWGGFDTEETALGIFSSHVHYLHLFRGEWVYWLDSLGFGTPMPIGHRLDAHPAFALAGLTTLRVGLSALWIAQIALGVYGFLRVTAMSGIRRPLRLVLLVCWIVSVPAMCWYYENDWVTFVVGWTSLPFLLFLLRRAIDAGDRATRRSALAGLSLGMAFLVLNSHPGYVAPLVIALTVYALAAAPLTRAMYGGFATAGALCVAMTSERLYYFASEAMFFYDKRRYSQPEYQLAEYARALVAPVTPVDGNMRLPFIGVALLIAVFALVPLWRRAPRHVRACGLTAVVAFLLSIMPPSAFSLYTASSGGWLFRDPMFVFMLIGGGWALQQGLDAPKAWARWGVAALLLLQVTQQGLTIRSGAAEYYARREYGEFAPLADPGRHVGDAVLRHTPDYGPRVYLSPQAQVLARAALTSYGIRVVTDLSIQGAAPITAWFKVVSMDPLYPAIGFMHGHIGAQPDVLANQALLDVLDVGLVLSTESEGPPPPGLDVLERIPVDTFRGPDVLVLLGNTGRWPRAVLMDPQAADLTLPQRPECPNDRALCRDFAPLAARRVGDVSTYASDNGAKAITFTPAAVERLLFVSTTYRPEWEARGAGGPLPVVPVAGAFIGVRVPPGTDHVDLSFQPAWRIRLQWLSLLTAAGLVSFLAARRWRR
ncbi:MAG: hypothetical protein AB7O67_04500 [Vicinamibacterales bacterium]